MSVQECALYGDLVLWLRDRAAELLAEAREGSVEEAAEELDALIRSWFFTPQDELHGLAPRDIIWAEYQGKPNPIPPEALDEMFFDDCPICRELKADVERALAEGRDPGFSWHYDNGGYPLIARYDPEGWEACWAEEETPECTAAPAYEPPSVEEKLLEPEAFLEVMRYPWLDPALHRAAEALEGRMDVPTVRGGYRRLTRSEALSLVAGLDRQGVDVGELLKQIEVWPYQNVALDWLSEPERNVALICRAMETKIPLDDEEERRRFRHHRDFILNLARLIPPHARLWLRGWLDAVGQLTDEAPF
jgi:hypothetical protein